MEELKEEWKPINGYEGIYEISNYGNVKSLIRKWRPRELILVNKLANGSPYYHVRLYRNKQSDNFRNHVLVWNHFGNKIRENGFHIDHIDGNKLNNKINNLQLLSARENISKGNINIKKSSKYMGVCYSWKMKKWCANIYINGFQKYLGSFNEEYDAHLAYEEALDKI